MSQEHKPLEENQLMEKEAQPQQTGAPMEPDEIIEGPVDGYMTRWGEYANKLSQKTWKILEYILGIAMGVGCAACIYFIESKGFLPLNFILALAIAKVGPNAVEKWLEREMPRVRIIMVVALGAVLILYTIYLFATGQGFADPVPTSAVTDLSTGG